MQSPLMSAVETATNLIVGYLGAIALTMTVFPALGHDISWSHATIATAPYALWSLVRGYSLRRLFNRLLHRR
mgnify:CR=1 FL=1